MKTFLAALRFYALLTVLTGLVYPAAVTVVARWAFPQRASGSLVTHRDRPVGSRFLAQKFSQPHHFWPRPSASDFATLPSGASNLGPTSSNRWHTIAARLDTFRAAHALDRHAPVPAEMLGASGSGLDPHISPAAARLQAPRVAAARGLDLASVLMRIDRLVEAPQFGCLGEPRVNVLLLNLALDEP